MPVTHAAVKTKKFNHDTVQMILEAAQQGHSQNVQAALAGIDISTLHRWLRLGKTETAQKEYKEFVIAYARAKAQFEVQLLNSVVLEGTAKTKLEVLARKDSKNWGQTIKVEQVRIEESKNILNYLEKHISEAAFDEVVEALSNSEAGE